MKKYNKNKLNLGAICFSLFFGIFTYLSILIMFQPPKESFTPGIRQTYRPYIRQTRILSEGFYNSSENSVTKLLRKFNMY